MSARAILIYFACLQIAHAGTIETLSLVESNNRDGVVGSHSERSRWQMMPYVWSRWHLVAGDEFNVALCRRVVVLELKDREREFMQTHHRKPTAKEWCWLWHCPARVDHPTMDDQEYARRFALAQR